MARRGILTALAAPSIVALGIGLSACTAQDSNDVDTQPGHEQTDIDGDDASMDDAGDTAGTDGGTPEEGGTPEDGEAEVGNEADADSTANEQDGSDEHTPVEESEPDDGFDPEAEERWMCELLSVDELESVYGVDFSEPGNADDADHCMWVSAGGGEEFVELTAEQITLEGWERIRQEQGVASEDPGLGDDSFIDDSGVGYLLIDNIVIIVDEGFMDDDAAQTDEVLATVDSNL